MSRRREAMQEALRVLEQDVVLAFLRGEQEHNPDYPYYSITYISMVLGLSYQITRALLWSLTDQGLTEYRSGLFSEDGEPRGSGYAAVDPHKLQQKERAA